MPTETYYVARALTQDQRFAPEEWPSPVEAWLTTSEHYPSHDEGGLGRKRAHRFASAQEVWDNLSRWNGMPHYYTHLGVRVWRVEERYEEATAQLGPSCTRRATLHVVTETEIDVREWHYRGGEKLRA